MTLTKTNAVIAALIALVNSIFPLLQILGVIDLTPDGMAAVYLVVSNVGTVAGLILAGSPVTNTPDPR